jgi:hypothetical protein
VSSYWEFLLLVLKQSTLSSAIWYPFHNTDIIRPSWRKLLSITSMALCSTVSTQVVRALLSTGIRQEREQEVIEAFPQVHDQPSFFLGWVSLSCLGVAFVTCTNCSSSVFTICAKQTMSYLTYLMLRWKPGQLNGRKLERRQI